ncbi:MAG: hypothetical protein EHM45_02150 [Desulfobacteraceae bacterium]|nr:MAG: hypothetical protein EHM45_02150 [Desulfobacteraceae bacterium]
MKKATVISLFILIMVVASWSQSLPRFDISLFGGYGLTSLNGMSQYSNSWSAGLLWMVDESATIKAKSKAGNFYGGGVGYYITPKISLGLNIGFIKGKVETTSDAKFNWQWTDGRSAKKDMDFINADDSIQSMVLSLNLTSRFGGERLQGFVRVGPTLFFNKVKLNSAFLYGVFEADLTRYPVSYYQYVDALTIPIELNQSWTGLGADLGAGCTLWITPAFGLTLDARYFFCPKKSFDWNFITGTYDGTFYTQIKNVTVSEATIAFMNNTAQTPLEKININPSFFQLGIGCQIRLF